MVAGANATDTSTLSPGATAKGPGKGAIVNSGRATVTEAMLSAAVPAFRTRATRVSVFPATTAPNSSDGGVSAIAGSGPTRKATGKSVASRLGSLLETRSAARYFPGAKSRAFAVIATSS